MENFRVKVEYLDLVNGDGRCPDKTNKSTRKRQRHIEEHQPEENNVSVEWKKKRRVEKQKVKQVSVNEKKKRGACKEKKKKKTEEKVKSAASTKTSPVRVDQPDKTKKSPVAQRVSSSSSTSSEEEEAPQKPAPKHPSSAPTSSCIQSQTKQHPPSSSSSESSSDETTCNKAPSQKPALTSTIQIPKRNDALSSQPALPVELLSNCAQKQASSTLEQPSKASTSGSEEEIEFVIRKPVQPSGFGMGGSSSWRGFGRRGKNGCDGSAQRGRGSHRGGFRGQNGSFEDDPNGAINTSYQTDSLTNTSVVLQVCFQGFFFFF